MDESRVTTSGTAAGVGTTAHNNQNLKKNAFGKKLPSEKKLPSGTDSKMVAIISVRLKNKSFVWKKEIMVITKQSLKPLEKDVRLKWSVMGNVEGNYTPPL